jgi:tight adherence protein B
VSELAAGLAAAALVVATAASTRAAVRSVARARTTARLAAGCSARRPKLLTPPAWIGRRLAAADVEADASVVWTSLVAAAAVAVPAAALSAGPGLAVVVTAALVAGPLVALTLNADRRDRRLEAALPEALEGMARSLRSGASVRLALGEAASGATGVLAADLRGVSGAVAAGAPLPAALDGWAERRPLTGVRLAVAAVGLGAETGGASARALDGVAETLRGRLAVAAEVRSLSSQASLSGLVIALAPVAFSALATMSDARTADFLFRTPLGLACLVVGLGLDAVAAVWMARLCRVDA